MVNGEVIEEMVHQEAFEEDENRPLNLDILIGYKIDEWDFAEEYTVSV